MKWFYVGIVSLGVFMVVLGTTSVNVAMPRMIAPLHTDLFGIEWVSISYLISTAITMLAFNTISGIHGFKKVYIAGLIFYTLGSILAGQAHSLLEMIIFRSTQGIGEGLVIPAGQAIIQMSFSKEERGRAMGIYALGMSFAPGLGPTIGGYLVEYISWRSIFYINVPISILLLALGVSFLPSYHVKSQKTMFNIWSFLALSSFSISSIVLLSKGEKWGWFSNTKSIYFLTISVLSFLVFLLLETIFDNKLVGLEIFKNLEFTLAVSVFVLVQGLTFFQTVYTIPIYFERVRDLGTFETGLHIFPYAIGIGVFSLIGGKLADKINPSILIFFSEAILMITLFFFLSNIDYYTPRYKITLYMLLIGCGMGLFFAPILKIAFNSVKQELMGLSTAIYGYMRLIGASLGTSIATNIITSYSAKNFDYINDSRAFNSIGFKLFEEKFDSKILAKAVLYKFQMLLSEAYGITEVFRFSFYAVSFSVVITIVLYFYIEKGKSKIS
ncbi:MAG: DHA2 family efflux MFS transporter permease subunit [Hydrogenobaculum sp.]|nr:MAG: MFS transporter [Hydrogenobaculum sp.]